MAFSRSRVLARGNRDPVDHGCWLDRLRIVSLLSPLFNIENNGSDAKGWGKRIRQAGSGIGNLALAFSAYQLASSTGGSGNGTQDAASGVLSMDFGGTVLGLLGMVFFVVTLFQAKKDIPGDFMDRISAQAPEATRRLGGAGYIARAVVYAVIGLSLFEAGFLAEALNRLNRSVTR